MYPPCSHTRNSSDGVAICLAVLFLARASGTRPIRDQDEEGAQMSFLLRGDAAASKEFDAIGSDKDAKLNSMNVETQQMKQQSIPAQENSEMQKTGGSELERFGSDSTQASSEVSSTAVNMSAHSNATAAGVTKCATKTGCKTSTMGA